MSRPRRTPPFPTLLLAPFLCGTLSCTDVGTQHWFDQPSEVPFTVVAVAPPPDAFGVALDQGVDIYLSDLPDPDSASRSTFLLRSGPTQFTGGFRVDLLDRRLRYLPARSLPTHLEMRVFVGRHLRSLDGRELGTDLEWGFTTGENVGAEVPLAPAISFDEIAPTLAARCAAGCHEGPDAYHGLDLSSAAPAYDGLVGRDSEERPALSRVAAGDHARSYLVRKLLHAPTIVGDRMPPPPLDPLDAPALRRVADWIDGGARR